MRYVLVNAVNKNHGLQRRRRNSTECTIRTFFLKKKTRDHKIAAYSAPPPQQEFQELHQQNN